jgi:hypothetical protein
LSDPAVILSERSESKDPPSIGATLSVERRFQPSGDPSNHSSDSFAQGDRGQGCHRQQARVVGGFLLDCFGAVSSHAPPIFGGSFDSIADAPSLRMTDVDNVVGE